MRSMLVSRACHPCLYADAAKHTPLLLPIGQDVPVPHAALSTIGLVAGPVAAATQPAATQPGPSTPPPAKRNKCTEAEQAAGPSQPTKGKVKAQGKAAEAKLAPQPGRDSNAALNMQCIGESKWRPLELCYWPEQGKLPAKGKEYPELGYKRLQDKPPQAQQQQQ
ncbi:hypothetical protein QJQ45_006339 [Haematococcus lacustris]|nr:hypothetical protein QJQ45_006339 [Haematococcus lacustris]